MRNYRIIREMSLLMVFVVLCSITGFFSFGAYAAGNSVQVNGKVFTFDEDAHYEYSTSESYEVVNPGTNTYGSLSVLGTLSADGAKNGFPSYLVSDGSAQLIYSYTDGLLTADEESWHLVEDKTKKVDDITLSSNIQYGALILQTSKDGKSWFTDLSIINIFKDTPTQTAPFYSANSIQLANGCYYRVVVVYKTAIKTGENQYWFVSTDKIEYKKTAEVYEFYLHDSSAAGQESPVMSRNLGTLTNTGKDNGYSGSTAIGINDPHYGWEIGHFFVSGYTRETKDDSGTPVFLKNVGDQITLWFNLEQDIDRLNGSDTLSISDDTNGYDQYFQTGKTDMGRGTLFIRYTDEKGVKHPPEIYTNYLLANASTSADTIVRLFEEGDYEVALDYEIKSTPRVVAGVEVVPEYTNYRIFFKFSVRNGNCMVFPFDVVTGDELANEAITPNGFKLDMARSRYLTIDVRRSVVTEGPNGYVEDVRFNRPAKDGDSYTDPGIYVFSVKNLYTGESTTKTIYVGSEGYMKALSVNQISVSQLNELIAQGAIIGNDGTITMPTPSPEPEASEPTPEPTPEAVSTEEPITDEAPRTVEATEEPIDETSPNVEEPIEEEAADTPAGKSYVMPIATGSVVVVIIAYVIFAKKKKTVKEGSEK